ncbi:hypothetical protein OQA88_2586 [Cercophora sp. LCS_1]
MATYTKEQLARYYEHIGFTPSEVPVDVTEDELNLWKLKQLTQIQYRHMERVPFESLYLHYTRHRTLSLDPQDLYDKVVNKGRGGYCMEINQFFAVILRTAGFNIMTAGGRVLIAGVDGWNHQVTIVTIGNQKYLVDVAFGSGCSLSPVPLQDGIEFELVAPARGKLEYRALTTHTNQDQRVWVYSFQEAPPAPWLPKYCFVEIEFFPADFAVMNQRTMAAPQSFFVQNVMCVRTVLGGPPEDPKPVATLILFRNYLKRISRGQEEVLATFKLEEERIAALKEWFNIDISPAERNAIRGLPTELRASYNFECP